jgi:hypothetical protein
MLGSSSLSGPLADEIGELIDTESIRARSSALRGDSIECTEVILYAVFARLSRCAQPVDCYREWQGWTMSETMGRLVATGQRAEVFEWGSRVVKLYRRVPVLVDLQQPSKRRLGKITPLHEETRIARRQQRWSPFNRTPGHGESLTPDTRVS